MHMWWFVTIFFCLAGGCADLQVKNERNKAVKMIQTAQQAAAEMKEKIGILQNEIEILQNETNAKEKALWVASRASRA